MQNETLQETAAIQGHTLAPEVRWFGIIVGSLSIVIGTLGNFLTILVIVRNRSMQTKFNMFIANLCVIDFLTAATMLPVNVASYVLGRWPFPRFPWWCSLQAFYYYCCGYTSTVCLIAISVNRLVGICFPLYYNKIFSRRKIWFELAFTWLLAPLLMAPFFFNNGFQWVDKYSLCVFNNMQFNAQWMHYMQFTRITFQMVPVFVFIVIYSIIFVKVRGSGMQVIKMSLKSNSGTSTSEDSTTRDDELLVKKKKYKVLDRLPHKHLDKSFSAATLEVKKPQQIVVRPVLSAPGGDNKEIVNGRFVSPKGDRGLTKIIQNRQNVDFKLLGMSITIVICFMALFLPSVIINLLPGSKKFAKGLEANLFI
ncbi:Oidioi.mRNA.OKI2018_I69.PAR.g10473.t1.cds [Oikopleura dioica]|uniref:Oidioi.mRNA.OKI2018_I69.PAR.g10473.t1.cds n=1 Tax=Oikopleura dioica TaxID=34765 RepID=A0ABN7RQU4_OIKDI|nr:Oidioi.mRNA.OKI2018_I69.PAR.g10473.t1.cds [Oikopleura dioica]